MNFGAKVSEFVSSQDACVEADVLSSSFRIGEVITS